MENITNISVQYALRHVETIWLSMKGAAVRIINIWENLCQYFMKLLPTQKTFKQTVKKQCGTKALKTQRVILLGFIYHS